MSTLTKTFIVLTLVFSLALAVLLVLEVGKISPYNEELTAAKAQGVSATVALQQQQNLALAKQSELSKSIDQLQKSTADLTQQINALNIANQGLATEKAGLEARAGLLTSTNTQSLAVISSMKDQLSELMKENSSIRPQITDLIQKNAELNRVNNELQTQNRFAEQAIRKLQEQIADAGSNGASGAINQTGNQVTAVAAGGTAAPASPAAPETRSPVNGRITHIAQAAGRTLIETPLGSSSQVKVGTHFTIYRNNGQRAVWVGDAVVSNVTDDASVATVTNTNDGQQPQQGDLVMSGNAGPNQ